MLNNMKKLIILFSMMVMSTLAQVAYAQTSPQMTTPTANPQAQQMTTPVSNVTARATLENPLKVKSLSELFTKLVQFAVNIGYFLIAFFLLLSGFKFVKAQGNEAELETAKRTFYYTIIGAIIIVGAQTIILVVQSIIKGLQV
jgi:hypothetical protein